MHREPGVRVIRLWQRVGYLRIRAISIEALLDGSGSIEWSCPAGGVRRTLAGERSMSYQERIVSDAGICGGQPVIRGTRVLVRVILGYLAHGEPTETILREFPSLTEADVRAVISFAAAAASEDLPAPAPLPPAA